MFKIINDISIYLLKHPTKRYSFRDTSSIDRIVVHQTDTEDQGQFSAYAIANYHVNTNDWAGIGYHYLITDDGKIYQTNRDDLTTYHASGWNSRSIGIAITGNHVIGSNSENYDIISKKKYNALVFLLAKLSNKYNLKTDDIVGHTETGSPKSCPNLNLTQLRLDVKKKGYFSGSERVLSLCA